jgi:hypothetical protein
VTSWRLISDTSTGPAAFLPFPPTEPARSRAITTWNHLVNGPTPEEIKRYEELRKQQDDELREKLAEQMNRHAMLLTDHANDRIVAALLDRHAPNEQASVGQAFCRGCPLGWNYDDGEYYQSWPCPVWTTIDDLTSR